MGNFFSSDSYDAQSSRQGNITSDFNRNSGDGNQFNCGNITKNYYGGTGSSGNQTEILQCLYKSVYESHRRRVREPVEGTCTWVTEHPKYQEWMGKKAAGLLWLSADPGYGKSVMASFLVGHLKKQTGAIVCYFFCKDDSEEQRSATLALCAILHQLFSQRNTLCRYAGEAFKAKGKKFTEDVDTLCDILVKAVAGGEFGHVICVVDALDECEEDTIAPLIRHITRLPGSQTSDTPLKFLVTSRPYHRFERDLGSPATTIRLKGEDEVDYITSDVTRVIDEGIENLDSYWRRPGQLEYLRNLLKSSADRTFLWVSLVIGILKDSGDDSVEEFTSIVSTAPHDLAGLYTKILDKGASPDKARRILKIVVSAARPLTLREMNIAFRIRREHNSTENLEDLPDGFEKTVKSLCVLFVRVIDSKIYLVHQTAGEFLIKGSLSGQGNWQYTLCLKESNFPIADICISYLSREEFAGSPLADDKGIVSAEALNDYLQNYSFLDYATRHWGDHFRDSQDLGRELFEFTQPICEAGPKNCLTWFQVYWFNKKRWNTFPSDFTHPMTASFLGLEMIVDRLLEEDQDINARSNLRGTALNVAASAANGCMTRKLLRKNVKAYFGGKEYNILQTKTSELQFPREFRMYEWEWDAIDFIFCIQDAPEPHTLPDGGTTS